MTTAVLVAGGPSLTDEQERMIKAAHALGKVWLLVVNNMWQRFPDADVLYGSDRKWWRLHWPAVRTGFAGECWTRDNDAAREHGLCWIKSQGKPGLSREPKIIHEGMNGGYALINLTRHFLMQEPDADRRIVLVGYDMQRGPNGEAHSYPDHPKGWGNSANPQKWAPHFVKLAADLQDEGVSIVNCSIRTALTLPRADLAETLATV